MFLPPNQTAFDESIHTRHGSARDDVRVETDSLGAVELPANVYWGINTARALENFAISGRPISEFSDFVIAYACVKQAAARANAELGVLERGRAELIDHAAEEIKQGGLFDQFVVDIIQGGAGTSTNMNVNEVLANRGLELGGHRRGDYHHLNPNDDVNCSQSTNDTYPTALKLALGFALERLVAEMERLEGTFHTKGGEFADVLKVGRTQLQDAVPMTLGQEFESFAVGIEDDRMALHAVLPMLWETNMGATAVGTGITAGRGFAEAVRRHLAEITGRDIRTARHLVAATTDMGAFLQLAGVTKRFAMRLSKICNDLRLLASGPQFGLGEIRLPPRQAGSSIMPGKVNPVIPEVVNQVCFVVAGCDTVVALASEAGQLQLNAFGPVIAYSLLGSLKWLTAALMTLRERCVVGITANRERLAEQTMSFVGVITAFTPYIGYRTASALAQQALASQTNIADLIVARGLMPREDVQTLMESARLSGEDTSKPKLVGDYRREATQCE
ncbi:MAG: aspartate ammonia-lyase [Chloroflexi bacterium]|nr:aspartate ammonia-lyase [Chloroflexota bacterium]